MPPIISWSLPDYLECSMHCIVYCIALHTVLKYLTYQYAILHIPECIIQTEHVLKYVLDIPKLSFVHTREYYAYSTQIHFRQYLISIIHSPIEKYLTHQYHPLHVLQWVLHVAFIMSTAICYLCYIKQCLGRGGSVGGPSFVPLIYTH